MGRSEDAIDPARFLEDVEMRAGSPDGVVHLTTERDVELGTRVY